MKQIAILGKKFHEEDNYFQKKEQARAVYALSKLLEIYQKYFKNASAKKYEVLMNSLRLKFQVSKNSKTTAFHLLSRQFRNNDTKQASSDAKILNFAEKMGKDEHTFAPWISECGGLTNARDLSAIDAKNSKNASKTVSLKKKNPKAVFKKMNESFLDVIREKQAHKVFSISQNEMPKMFGAVKPWSGQSIGMLGVYVSEGNLYFYQLLDYVPKFGEHQTEVPDAVEE